MRSGVGLKQDSKKKTPPASDRISAQHTKCVPSHNPERQPTSLQVLIYNSRSMIWYQARKAHQWGGSLRGWVSRGYPIKTTPPQKEAALESNTTRGWSVRPDIRKENDQENLTLWYCCITCIILHIFTRQQLQRQEQSPTEKNSYHGKNKHCEKNTRAR